MTTSIGTQGRRDTKREMDEEVEGKDSDNISIYKRRSVTDHCEHNEKAQIETM